MAFTKLTTTQNEFLESFLRGTSRTLTNRQASALYGIKNARARYSELRHKYGLRVRTDERTEDGRVKYAVSARDVNGSKARVL